MSRLTSHDAYELGERDFRLGDPEETWEAIEARYPEFTVYDTQRYLDAVMTEEIKAEFYGEVLFNP